MEQNPTQLLTIEIVPDGRPDLKILKLNGPVTIHNYFEFQEIARKQPLPQVLVVDLHDVPYIDSAALGSFVAIHVDCEAGGRRYALVGANERLRNLFDLTHAREFLVTYDSLEEATAQLA